MARGLNPLPQRLPLPLRDAVEASLPASLAARQVDEAQLPAEAARGAAQCNLKDGVAAKRAPA